MDITENSTNLWFFSQPALVDIGSASFNYDMRRLTEILAFPRAWYRRKIVRRLFLGDTTARESSAASSSSARNSSSSNEFAPWVIILVRQLKR